MGTLPLTFQALLPSTYLPSKFAIVNHYTLFISFISIFFCICGIAVEKLQEHQLKTD